jgi:Ni/Co efflux regulator RcnB
LRFAHHLRPERSITSIDRESTMHNRFLAFALVAASLCGASVAFAQASGLDRNTPDTPQFTAPEAPARADRRPEAPARPAARGEQGRTDATPRQRDDTRRDQARRDHDGRDGQRRDADRRHGERRDWDRREPQRRDYGYVVPRPYFVPAPPVYYSAPPVYYGGVPQPYYPGYAVPQVFRAGDYLPPEFLGPQYAVADWYWRGLSAPPYGYQWVLLAPDNYALVALGTGQIVSLVVTR